MRTDTPQLARPQFGGGRADIGGHALPPLPVGRREGVRRKNEVWVRVEA